MTEAEAVAKWCPHGRVGHRDGMALNDPNLPNFSVRCHGSECMAWRWSPGQSAVNTHPASGTAALSVMEPARPDRLPASWVWVPARPNISRGFWREPVDEVSSRRRGYCGLAGKPTP